MSTFCNQKYNRQLQSKKYDRRMDVRRGHDEQVDMVKPDVRLDDTIITANRLFEFSGFYKRNMFSRTFAADRCQNQCATFSGIPHVFKELW